jgi:phage portal protein BeeE
MAETSLLRRLLRPFLGGAPRNEAKALVQPPWAPAYGTLTMLPASSMIPATRHDYAKEVGDGLGSSVLAAPLNFLMRTFPEAPPIVRRFKQGQWEEDPEHDLIRLIENPNPNYGGEELLMATALDYAFGNAFWIKVRNAFGGPVQLWWMPRGMIRPVSPAQASTTFIERYEYNVGGKWIPLDVRDVVHFRFGLDPRDRRMGLSPLGALVREVGIDDTAANFNAAILRNLGIIGLIVSLKEKGTVATREALKALKDDLIAKFTGDRRGDPLAVGTAVDVNLLQYQMQNFDVSPIRDVSEERVCAALGLPAAVVGFGTGLQQTKVGATMKEMRQLAWTGGLIPVQRAIAKQIDRQLLPEFESGRRHAARFSFDVSQVRALWEDNNEKHERVRGDYESGLIDRAEARRETGRVVRDEDRGVYYTPTAKQPSPEPKSPAPPADDDTDPKDET